MAIGGIGNIGNYYSNWFNNMYRGSTGKMSSTDLMSLMKKADEVRSPSYRKKMIEGGGTDGEIGTVNSEKKLSDTAASLTKSASALSSMSMKDLEDTDTLVKNVKSFAEDYNGTIEALQKSNSVDALKEGVNMKNTVGAFAGALKRVGITVGSDNKLTVDEEKLKKADKNSIAAVFKNNYSVIGRVEKRAEGIKKSALNKAMTTAFTQSVSGQNNNNKNAFGFGYGYGSFGGSYALLGSVFDKQT